MLVVCRNPDHPSGKFQALALGEQFAPVTSANPFSAVRQGLFALLCGAASASALRFTMSNISFMSASMAARLR
jgi:hypothetical protein